MVRITNLTLPPDGDETLLKKKAAKALGLSVGKIHRCIPVRQSIDARKKENVHYVMTVDVAVSNEEQVVAKAKSKQVSLRPEPKPYVVSHRDPHVSAPACGGGERSGGPAGGAVSGESGASACFAGAGPGRWSSGSRMWKPSGQGGGAGPAVQRPVRRGRRRHLLRRQADHRHPRPPHLTARAGGLGGRRRARRTSSGPHKPHIGTDLLRQVVTNLRQELSSPGL